MSEHDSAPLLFAFDPGGTKCHAVVVAADGRAVGWGVGQAPGLNGRSEAAFVMAAKQALGDRYGANPVPRLHVAAAPRYYWLERLRATLDTVFFAAEEEAALTLAGEKAGVVALSGTGSFVYGLTRTGRELKLDGYGPTIGDIGSAYHIGMEALRAAAQADWHPRHATTLQARVLDHLRLESTHRLIEFSLIPQERTTIAALARIVDDEARAGDGIAVRILREAADAFAGNLHDLVDRLDMTGERYPLIASGSVATGSDLFWERVCACAREWAPLLEPRRLAHPPVLGFALHGLRRLYPERYDTLARTLLASYAAVQAAATPGRA